MGKAFDATSVWMSMRIAPQRQEIWEEQSAAATEHQVGPSGRFLNLALNLSLQPMAFLSGMICVPNSRVCVKSGGIWSSKGQPLSTFLSTIQRYVSILDAFCQQVPLRQHEKKCPKLCDTIKYGLLV